MFKSYCPIPCENYDWLAMLESTDTILINVDNLLRSGPIRISTVQTTLCRLWKMKVELQKLVT